MTSLSEAAGKSTAAKRNQSEMGTVSDVTAPSWRKPSGSGKLGQKKGG